jgi:hypothetical protein
MSFVYNIKQRTFCRCKFLAWRMGAFLQRHLIHGNKPLTSLMNVHQKTTRHLSMPEKTQCDDRRKRNVENIENETSLCRNNKWLFWSGLCLNLFKKNII